MSKGNGPKPRSGAAFFLEPEAREQRQYEAFRQFLDTPARIRVTDAEVQVRLSRRAHHPILLSTDMLDLSPCVPWWGGRRLTLEIG